jgi:peptidylprolyl isomerase
VSGLNQPKQKHSLWYRLIQNRWVVFGGMGVLVAGFLFGGLFAVWQGDTGGTVRGQMIRETATPEPAATPTPDPNATPTPTPAPTPTPPVRQYAAPPEMQIDQNRQYFATIRTERGNIRIELFPREAPQTVNNFVFLARNDFFDGLTFHRVLEGFVAQGGDPTGTGTGGPGYFLPEERNNLRHDAGVIAMARSAQGVSGSQFYITKQPQPALDAQGFTVFGRVVSGMEVVQAITLRDPQRNPRAAPGDRILSIDIEER